MSTPSPRPEWPTGAARSASVHEALRLAERPLVLLPQLEPEYAAPEVVDDVLENRFEFCGERHDLGERIRWLENPSRDIEWHILLHKFYYAVALAERFRATGDERLVVRFAELVTSWIEQTPPNFIAADVTARRLQNWIYAWYVLRGAGARFAPAFEIELKASVARQTECLIDQMAPARNHRTLELYAVFLVALAFPEIATAGAWLKFAVAEMTANIRTDLLEDGVQCELSTDYHHIVLRNHLLFYRLCALNGIELADDVPVRLCRALDFAMHVHRPDGVIPALSDSDSRSHRDLLAFGADWFGREDYRFVATSGARGQPPQQCDASFAASGYHVQRSAWTEQPFAAARYLVFDCGPIGAGNHGHIDALSIELAAYGRPLVVDPGRFTYHEGGERNWRARFRGTAVHNTVTVDGRDQAIYRARTPGGRLKILAPHPQARLVASGRSGPIRFLRGALRSPSYDTVHSRHILFVRELYWLVIDVLQGDVPRECCLNFQLTPAAADAVEVVEGAAATIATSPGLRMILVGGQGATRVEEGFVSARYGVKERAPCVRVRRRGAAVTFATLLLPFRGVPPGYTCFGEAGRERISIACAGGVDHWQLGAASVTFSAGDERCDFALHGAGHE